MSQLSATETEIDIPVSGVTGTTGGTGTMIPEQVSTRTSCSDPRYGTNTCPRPFSSVKNQGFKNEISNGDYWILNVSGVLDDTSNYSAVNIVCNAPVSEDVSVSSVKATVNVNNLVAVSEIVTVADGKPVSSRGTTRIEKRLGQDEEGSIVMIAEFTEQDYTFTVTFNESFTKVLVSTLLQPLDILALSAAANAPPPPDGQPILNVSARTDVWGCNLGEMAATVKYTGGFFPNGYLGTNLVASLLPNTPAPNPLDGVYQTLYSARPDLQGVLDGSGSSLLEQTNGLNEEDPSGYDNAEFYARIIAYSTLKYFLSGLISNGKFNEKWLLGKYNECFLKKLGKSKFRYYLRFFVEPKYGFVGLNRYFREEIEGCLVCLS